MTSKYARNLFKEDAFLMGLVKRYINETDYLLLLPRLMDLGEDVLNVVAKYADNAEKNPPKLKNYDVFNHRVDELDISWGWRKLGEFSIKNRLIALGYDKGSKTSRCAQAATQILFSAFSSTYSCPLAMTDGAISVISKHACQSIKDEVLPKLLGKGDKISTCGQWMTEITGGSDLRSIKTHATFTKTIDDKEIYRLYGLKWFASSVDSEYALVLANVADYGPTLFLLRVWKGERLSSGIKLDKLKDKLGTKGLATAEVRLEGAKACLIGAKGKGILAASSLLNITRFYNALASSSSINKAFYIANNYSLTRKSFGKQLNDHVLHKKILADIEAKRSGAIALCLEIAKLLGACESSQASDSQKKMLRVLTPLAKLMLGKWAVHCASDAIEAMGGIGYLEDSGMPQILRDAQVFPIWEGTGSMMLYDIMRAQRKDNALVVLLKELCMRANNIMIDEAGALRVLKLRLQQISERIVSAVGKEDGATTYLEPIIRKQAFIIGSCTMALLIAESKPFVTEKDPYAHNRFTTFVENNLCGNFSI